MSDPFIGQIEAFGFAFAPRGWAQCSGQLLSIPQNQALFALLGTAFGGDGQRTFALPDMRGRVAMGQGSNPSGQWSIGQTGGEEMHTLSLAEIPGHRHTVSASANATTSTNTSIPGSGVALCVTTGKDQSGNPMNVPIYVTDPNPGSTLAPSGFGTTGGQPHENHMPTLTLNYCICLVGIFPSRN